MLRQAQHRSFIANYKFANSRAKRIDLSRRRINLSAKRVLT